MNRFAKVGLFLSVLTLFAGLSCTAEKPADAEAAKPAETGIEAAETAWLTDFEAAKKLSAQTKRPILADFSGSDWCGWCIKLDKEVFSQPAFQAYAKDNLVLFLADFPSRKEIPQATREQNQALSEKYGIRGYPTVLILDAEGNVLGTTGYQRGGPEAYVEHLKKLTEGARANDESTGKKAGA